MIDQQTPPAVTDAWPGRPLNSRLMPDGSIRHYLRVAALGDAFACAPDRLDGTPSAGWAELLAGSLSVDHDVSFWNLASPTSTTAQVRREQIPAAQAHHANLAALSSGLHDACRDDWHAETVRYRLMRTADELSWCGASLLTLRMPENGIVSTTAPQVPARVWQRIATLNEIYDEIDDAYGGIQLNLADVAQAHSERFWSTSPLQPSAYGHRIIASSFAAALVSFGLKFERHGLEAA